MKTRLIIAAMMVASVSFANAQEQAKVVENPTPDKKVVACVKRMSDKLLLDDSDAKKFEEIYMEYLEAKAACRPECTKGKELTDDQIEANLKAKFEAREKALEVDKKYYKKLSKVLNARQLNVIFGKKACDKRRMAPMNGGCKMKPCDGKPGAQNGKCQKAADCPKAKECKK